ncbi:MAG TPA: GEVED domain-containing protein, partial [Hymenobacter sp.]|nr:GEVED domain-containing protein [Hymenobacter sp.]
VTINTLNNTTTAPTAAPWYTNYPASGSTTTTLFQGITYALNITHGWYNVGGIWIDWNQSGSFDTNEFFAVPQNTGSTDQVNTINITVPATAATGQTKMRVRTEYYGYTLSSSMACSSLWYGETEDYTVTIATPPACSGTPAGGTVTGPTGACSGTNFTLNATGYTDNESGLSYQWQVSTASAAGPFTSVAGGTVGASVTTSQTVASWYRLSVTCSNGGGIGYSTVLSVPMNTFINCYCTPVTLYGSFSDYYGTITKVQLNNINNTTTNPTTSPYWTQYPASGTTTTNLDIGVTYSLNVTHGFYSRAVAWIDWNQSGTFDASEYYDLGFNYGYTQVITSANIPVPATAMTGQTKMRVRTEAAFYSIGSGSACATTYYGETEDYTVTVQVVPPCAGTPTAGGNTTATPPGPVCGFTSILLGTSTPPTQAPGIAYQWERSIDAGVTWTMITGETASSATVTGQTQSTQYRLNVTCTNSTLSAQSTPVTVTSDAAANCYCTPTYSTGNQYGDFINRVQLNTLDNLSGANAPGPNYYISYVTAGTPTTTLDVGSSYDISIQVGSYSSANYVAAWIDYNQDGVFSTSEKLGESGNLFADQFANLNFTVPATAVLGATRLRVREVFANTNLDPCQGYSYGETEDYKVTITSLPDCAGAPNAGTTGGTQNGSPLGSTTCSGIPFTLNVTGSSVGVSGGITSQWQVSTTGGSSWSNIFSANGATYTTSITGTTATSYRRVDSCSTSGLTSVSSTKTVTPTLCYCAATHTTTGTSTGRFISRVKMENGTLDNTTTGAASPGYTAYPNTANVQQGGYYWVSVYGGTNAAATYGALFFDWNQDGDFTDANETVVNYQWQIDGNGGVNHVLVNVPTTASLGTTRMRVRLQDSKFTIIDPCTNYSVGETEDYNVEITPSSCINPSVAGILAPPSPTETTNGDAITFSVTGYEGTIIGVQVSTVSAAGPWNPTLLTVYPGA